MEIHEAPAETEILTHYGHLVQELIRNITAEGMPRKAGVLVITTLGPAWCCELFDPDKLSGMSVVGRTLDEAVHLLDTFLQSKNPPWYAVRKNDLPK